MKNAHLAYLLYMLFFALLLGAIFITPLLSFSQDMGAFYSGFSYTCHQKISRSLCLFSDGKGYWVGDCTPQNGVFVDSVEDRTQIKEVYGDVVGYKMPVCSRDLGLYLAMFIGGLAYPFVRRIDDRYVMPAIYLVAAMVPLGIDGTVQLLSDLGLLPFVYESTNEIRLLTGAIAGVAAAFYAIPILVNLVSAGEDDAAAAVSRKRMEKPQSGKTPVEDSGTAEPKKQTKTGKRGS